MLCIRLKSSFISRLLLFTGGYHTLTFHSSALILHIWNKSYFIMGYNYFCIGLDWICKGLHFWGFWHLYSWEMHLPTRWETRVRSLGLEDPLEKEMGTHSNTLAWKIPWTEEAGTVHVVVKSWTRLSNFTFTFPFEKYLYQVSVTG